MFPDNRGQAGFGVSSGRLRLLVTLGLLASVTGAALWWNSARPSADDFAYLPASLETPGASTGQIEIVFRLSGPRGQQGFTLEQLHALPAVRYRATQPQLRKSFVYTGVPLRDLARLAGLSGQNLRVLADDQFGATVQADDYEHFPVMLAYLADSHPISVADKGPLEVVFPNEQAAARFRTSGSQWVWFATSLSPAP